MSVADENPGLFTFLAGLIVVVMAGVGLSLLADRKFKFSSGADEQLREINLDASEIAELSARRDERSGTLADAEAKLRGVSRGYDETVARSQTSGQRRVSLEADRDRLRAAITALEGDFARYRSEYRRIARVKAVGEEMGDLTLPGGRRFLKATIARVTDVGLEIRHEHGIARIQAPDLERKWQDRFQWSAEERDRRLDEERVSQAGDPEPPLVEKPAPARKPAVPAAKPAADTAKLKLLRAQVTGWKSKVARIQSDQATAHFNAANGNRTAVPGSLETWNERATALGRDLVRARSALAIAKSDLAGVSPHDPLLVEPPEQDP